MTGSQDAYKKKLYTYRFTRIRFYEVDICLGIFPAAGIYNFVGLACSASLDRVSMAAAP